MYDFRTVAIALVIVGGLTSPAMPALALGSIPLPMSPTVDENATPIPGPPVPAPVSESRATRARSHLTVTVQAEHQSYMAGAANEYTVEVRNLWTREAKEVPILLALPPTARFTAAGQGGISQNGGVAWLADVKPMHPTRLLATAVAGTPGADVQMVAATACALKTATTPQVCGSALIPVAPAPAAVPFRAIADRRSVSRLRRAVRAYREPQTRRKAQAHCGTRAHHPARAHHSEAGHRPAR